MTTMKVEGMGRSLDDKNDCYIDIRVTDECGIVQDQALIFVRDISISRRDWDRLEKARAAIKEARRTLEARR